MPKPLFPGRRWPVALLLMVAAALALIWTFLLRENRLFAEERQQRFEAERRVVADLVAENLLRQLQRLDDVLLLLRSEYVAERKSVDTTIALLRQGSLQELGARVTVIDRDGYVATSDAPRRPGERVYLGDRDNYIHFSSGGRDSLYISGPVQGRMTGAPGVQLSRPIFDARGQFAGVVAFFMEPRQLTAFVQHQDLGPDGVLTLYSAAGKVLGRSRDMEKHLGKQLSDELFGPFKKSSHGLVTRVSALDGITRTVAYRWLDRYPMLVMVAVSPRGLEEELLAQRNANLRKGMLLSLLVLLCGGAVAFYQLRRDRLETMLARERGHFIEAQRVANLGSWERDIPGNRVWWSDETYRILGYLPESQRPSLQAFLARVVPQDRRRVDFNFAQVREQGGTLDIACRLLLPGNVERYVHLGGRAERDGSGRPSRLTGTLQDVTDYMNMQQALADAEERWKFALDGADAGVWDWFVADNRAYFSPRWKAILGYRDEELPSRHEEWLERLHPDDRERAMAAVTDHFAGRTPVYEMEFRLRHKDGNYRWVLSRGKVCARDPEGRPLRMLGIISDISARKQAELDLARSEAMQRSLVSAMAEGVVVQDQAGKIISANASARRILRIGENLVGLDSTDPEWQAVREDGSLFPGRDHPAMVTLRTGVSCDNIIMGLHRPDAGLIWLSVNSRPLNFADERQPFAVVTSFADITEIKAAELSSRIYRDVLERAGRAILITDGDGTINNVNSAFVSLLGYSREECLGRRTGFFRSNRHSPEFFSRMWQALKTRGEWRGEIWNRRKTGEAILVELDIRSVTDAQGGVRQFVAVYQDVTELRRSQEEMWRLAHHDPLTGLPNRSLFLERLDQALAHARRQGERLGLLYMDLDGFKSVNDTYGHQAGDTVLQEVGRRLQNAVRTSDTVARLAGDEFAVLLAHLSVEDDLERVMGEIENAVARPVMWQGQELRVGVSIGSAVFPDQADVAESLIGAADQAMYLAKQQHRQAAGPGGAPFPSLQSLHST